MLLTPSPVSQTVTPSLTASPLERDVLYGRPLKGHKYQWHLENFKFKHYMYFRFKKTMKLQKASNIISTIIRIYRLLQTDNSTIQRIASGHFLCGYARVRVGLPINENDETIVCMSVLC